MLATDVVAVFTLFGESSLAKKIVVIERLEGVKRDNFSLARVLLRESPNQNREAVSANAGLIERYPATGHQKPSQLAPARVNKPLGLDT